MKLEQKLLKPNNAPSIHSENFLKREQWIRFAGYLLTISPAGNFFWTAALAGTPHWYAPNVLFAFAVSIPIAFWFLWASGFVVGCMMIAGRKAPWKLSLGILGINILFGLFNLKHDFRYGLAQPLFSLFINAALFTTLYLQEFHRKLEFKKWQERIKSAIPKAPPKLKAAPHIHSTHVGVEFTGIGVWAKFVSFEGSRISLLSLGTKIPADIENRMMEFSLSRDLKVRAKFTQKTNQLYHFELVGVDETTLSELNQFQNRLVG